MDKKLNWLQNAGSDLKSSLSKLSGAMMILAALQGMPQSADAQTLVNKKSYEAILEQARQDQQNIGEDMASYVFGGGIEKSIKDEIERQNTSNPQKGQDGKFSIFKDDGVIKSQETKQEILSKNEIKDMIKNKVDSLSQKDAATLYLAFHNYEKNDGNLVGHKKGKGEMGSGRHLAAFPVSTDVDFLEKSKELPYAKDELKGIKETFDGLYNKNFSSRKEDAKKNRESSKTETYESADLIALENARKTLVKNIMDKYIEPMLDKVFAEYYSTKKDDINNKKKK